jgi:RNA polymerase sigma-70 factor (ECF subfamily)
MHNSNLAYSDNSFRPGRKRAAEAARSKQASEGAACLSKVVPFKAKPVIAETANFARRGLREGGKAEAEREVVARAQGGDEKAFEELFRKHYRRVYSLCLRMTYNPAEAEDLCQESFLHVFRKLGTFRGDAAFSTWLHRLVVNVVLMHLRKKGLPQVSLDDSCLLDEHSPEREGEGRPRQHGTDDLRMVGALDRINLSRVLDRLPEGYRAVLMMHDVEGYEHNEIAKLRKCSIGNSKSQLHKARTRLRELLRPKLVTRRSALQVLSRNSVPQLTC